MAAISVQVSDPPAATVSENKQTTHPEATLQDVLDTLHDSNFFPRIGKDAPSRFWSTYERVAKQHDAEFLERHNGDLDVLLIFAGLFSAVSSAFIVNMQSNLSSNPIDTTNALLMTLLNILDNTTFPAQEAALPTWSGPSSRIIWIQTLAYTSLASSLLAAFGGVLGKQWLAHFKTSRFGQGALHERCRRRQQKFDGLKAWHLSTILATLPIFLQLSLFFFGVALAANVWYLHHTVASVIIATTAFGFVFYFFTVVSSLKSPDCPFQTPVSNVLRHVLDTGAFRKMIRRIWIYFLGRLLESSRHVFNTTRHLITRSLRCLVVYLLGLLSALRQVRSMATALEAALTLELGVAVQDVEFSHPEAGEERQMPSEELIVGLPEPPVQMAQLNAMQSSVVQWILETSTDINNIAAAAEMILEIEWPAEVDITPVLDRLKTHLFACFDPTRQVLPSARAWALACVKAMCHFYVERGLGNSFEFYTNGDLFFGDDGNLYHMDPDKAYLVVCCAVDTPVKLDISSLPVSDRMWMAHVFTYRLHKGHDQDDPLFVTFVIDFIGICIDPHSPARLVADCFLLAGMLIGMHIDPRHLTRLDKSQAIQTLRQSVMSHTLAVLLSETRERRRHQNASKLIHPLLDDMDKHKIPSFNNPHLLERVFCFCFRLLEEHACTPGDCEHLPVLIRLIDRQRFWTPEQRCTQGQFDLLVDYHTHICEGRDFYTIRDTFQVLEWLRGSPSTPDRMCRYIDTMIRFMGSEPTRVAALRAAWTVRLAVVSMGRDDESFRECFSKALASAVFSTTTLVPLDNNPFKKISFFEPFRDRPYLQLLGTLCNEPVWQPQLHQNSHFDNSLAIADTLLAERDDDFGDYAVHVAYILAIIDDQEDHPSFNVVQAYRSWPLILRAWSYIFNITFPPEVTECNWRLLSDNISLERLPSLVAYAKKRFYHGAEPLIRQVEQLCHTVEEERRQREQAEAQHTQQMPFGYRVHQMIPGIRESLLDSLKYI